MKQVLVPSLPQGRVIAAVCGGTRKIRDELSRYIPELIIPEPDTRLPEATRTHADMVCCHIDAGTFFTCDSVLAAVLESHDCKCTLTKTQLGERYPADALLNCARIGDAVIYGKRSAAQEIVWYVRERSMPSAAVAQGYVRCSCAIVDERSIITADAGIASAVSELGIRALLIEPGYIELPGYAYGFIGGACGKLSADTMYFSGSIDHHPDRKKILSFLDECEVTPVFGEGRIFDFGGFIPISEQ